MSDPMSEHGCHNCGWEESCQRTVKQTIGWCSLWGRGVQSHTSSEYNNGSNIVGDVYATKFKYFGAMPEAPDNSGGVILPPSGVGFSLDKLIDDHWGYIQSLLEAHSQEPEVIEIAEFHYRTAFRHGFGHGVEKCSKGDVEWDDQESRWKGRNTENGQS